MKTSPEIVRWLPLVVALAGCSTDLSTAPDAVDSSLLVTAQAGKKNGFQTSFVFEPSRYIQRAGWNAGYLKDFKNQPTTTYTYRECFLNTFEDLDGNDFYSVDPGNAYRHELVNEQDGFVMITEFVPGYGVIPTWIGRSTWDASFWFNNPDPNVTYHEISANSKAQGVVFPILRDGPGVEDYADPKVRLLMNWMESYKTEDQAVTDALLGTVWSIPEGYENIPELQAGQLWDVLNDYLGPRGRAVALINHLLTQYGARGQIRGTSCDADYKFVGYDLAANDPSWTGPVDSEGYKLDPNGRRLPLFSALHNTITFEKTWPKQLNRLFE